MSGERIMYVRVRVCECVCLCLYFFVCCCVMGGGKLMAVNVSVFLFWRVIRIRSKNVEKIHFICSFQDPDSGSGLGSGSGSSSDSDGSNHCTFLFPKGIWTPQSLCIIHDGIFLTLELIQEVQALSPSSSHLADFP